MENKLAPGCGGGCYVPVTGCENYKELEPAQTSPQTLIHIFTTKYDKPIPIIAFFDSGAAMSIMNDTILPDEFWKPEIHQFKAANGELFETRKVTRHPIILQFLPDCRLKTNILGSSIHGKDLIVGFDIYEKEQFLLKPRGIQSRKFFKPYIVFSPKGITFH